MIKAILAIGENGEIGQDGDMPWGRRLPKDLEYFKEVTGEDPVIMGSNTFKSLGMEKGLPNRDNWVITSKKKESIWQSNDFNQVSFDSINLVKKILESHLNKEEYWELSIIGGSSIYTQLWGYVEEIHITRVKGSFPKADTFLDLDLTGFEKGTYSKDVSGDDLEAYVEVWRRVL